MKLFLWLLQIVAETVRNLVMAYVSFVSESVGNILYGRCGVCHTICLPWYSHVRKRMAEKQL